MIQTRVSQVQNVILEVKARCCVRVTYRDLFSNSSHPHTKRMKAKMLYTTESQAIVLTDPGAIHRGQTVRHLVVTSEQTPVVSDLSCSWVDICMSKSNGFRIVAEMQIGCMQAYKFAMV